MGSRRTKQWLWAAGACAAALCTAAAAPAVARAHPDRQQPPFASDDAPSRADLTYVVRRDHWTADDERGYGEFIAAIGESNCRTVESCLKGPANPFRASDARDAHFQSDCADLPYYLRAYYAWKRGLPFAYEMAVAPLGPTNDIRYSPDGNEVTARRSVTTGSITGPALLDRLRNIVSSAMYRIHPDRETPVEPDLYSPALAPKAIRLGTVIYDPNGHLAIVYRIEKNGRILYIDAHPDNSLTRGPYDKRFVRSRPGMGAGFKNWRPIALKDYTRGPRGELLGGTIVAAKNRDIADFSDEQYFGNGRQRVTDANWTKARFTLNGESLEYYDYVRAKLGGGSLKFDPINELREMVRSNCADLHYRADAVTLALQAGLQNQAHPERLPYNIYGTNGDWETYSTPSRDARLKTAFKEVRDTVERFVRLRAAGDSKLVYAGGDLVGDLLAAYDQETSACAISYENSDRATVSLSYEDARNRLFRMSFDPYQCVELRWGAVDADELRSCRDGETKRDWYAAEQKLRNQIDRTYEARMDHDLAELRSPGGEGKGVGTAPEIDVRGYLLAVQTHGLTAATGRGD